MQPHPLAQGSHEQSHPLPLCQQQPLLVVWRRAFCWACQRHSRVAPC